MKMTTPILVPIIGAAGAIIAALIGLLGSALDQIDPNNEPSQVQNASNLANASGQGTARKSRSS